MRPTCPPSLRRYEFGSLHVEDVLVGRVRLQLVHFHDAAEQCVAHSAKNRGCDRYSGLRHRHASVIGHLSK